MKQVSVFLENRPGTLRELSETLSNGGINMKALSVAEAEGFGIARIIVDNVENTTDILKEAGFVHELVSVVAVRVPDETGGLAKILELFHKKEINIEYIYAFSHRSGDADFVFKVEDEKRAFRALEENKIEIIDEE